MSGGGGDDDDDDDDECDDDDNDDCQEGHGHLQLHCHQRPGSECSWICGCGDTL